jgi:hypothetical protein
MDVIGFLCVSLGSSRVQLHDSLGSRRACACSVAGFSSQNGDRVWGVLHRIAAFCFVFLWVKDLNAKDIHRETFPVYSRKRLPCKAVHNWVEKFSQERSEDSDSARPGAEVAATGVLRVSTSVSALVEVMSRNKYFVQLRISHTLRFISIYRFSFVSNRILSSATSLIWE